MHGIKKKKTGKCLLNLSRKENKNKNILRINCILCKENKYSLSNCIIAYLFIIKKKNINEFLLLFKNKGVYVIVAICERVCGILDSIATCFQWKLVSCLSAIFVFKWISIMAALMYLLRISHAHQNTSMLLYVLYRDENGHGNENKNGENAHHTARMRTRGWT